MVRFTPFFAGRSVISPSSTTCGIWLPSSQNTWPCIPCPSFFAVLQANAIANKIVKKAIDLKAFISFKVFVVNHRSGVPDEYRVPTQSGGEPQTVYYLLLLNQKEEN